VADRAASRRALRPKRTKLARCRRLRGVVERKLEDNWSPEQISSWLADTYPYNPEMQVSHEAICQSLFVQGKGALRKELHECLRSGRAMRRAKAYTRSAAVGQGKLKNMVMISERPVEVEDRAVPGHWEGDLIMGKKMTSIATLVERQSRYVMLCKLPNGHGAEAVRIALAKRIATLPANLRRTLTWDQGKEMAEHVRFTVETGVQVYFCDPKSPWQRGTNENTNGLLRQYLPKHTDLSLYSQQQLNAICTLTQWKASTNPRLDATISGVRRGCCVDPVRKHRDGDTHCTRSTQGSASRTLTRRPECDVLLTSLRSE
jgi:IS30 family transposase